MPHSTPHLYAVRVKGRGFRAGRVRVRVRVRVREGGDLFPHTYACKAGSSGMRFHEVRVRFRVRRELLLMWMIWGSNSD